MSNQTASISFFKYAEIIGMSRRVESLLLQKARGYRRLHEKVLNRKGLPVWTQEERNKKGGYEGGIDGLLYPMKGAIFTGAGRVFIDSADGHIEISA